MCICIRCIDLDESHCCASGLWAIPPVAHLMLAQHGGAPSPYLLPIRTGNYMDV
jgi:hypothetical protein